MYATRSAAGWRPCDIDARVAVWMDDGMLSRWLLDRWPTVEELLESLRTACPPVVLERIRRSLQRMGPAIGAEPAPDSPATYEA